MAVLLPVIVIIGFMCRVTAVITVNRRSVVSPERWDTVVIVGGAEIFVIGYMVAYLMIDNKRNAAVKSVPVHKK